MSHNSFNLSLSLFDLREIIASIEKVSNAALWQTCPEIKNEDVFWVKHGHQQNAKWTRCGKYSIPKAIFFSAFYGIRLFGHLIQVMLPDQTQAYGRFVIQCFMRALT